MTTARATLEDLHPELRSRVLAASGNADRREIFRVEPDDGPEEYVVAALSGNQVALMRLSLRDNGSVAEETDTFSPGDVVVVGSDGNETTVEVTTSGRVGALRVPAPVGDVLRSWLGAPTDPTETQKTDLPPTSAAHDASEYGRHIADDYDRIYGGAFDTASAVSTLIELAQGGEVLELGVGTGRLAIPLAEAGLTVHGIDGSQAMLDAMAAKPGGAAVAGHCGDFSTLTLDVEASLVVLAINTIYALPDQAAQVRCFATAAGHLRPGGCFVIDAWVPRPQVLDRPVNPRRLSPGYVGLVLADHDPVAQFLHTTQLVFTDRGEVRVFPVTHRYAHPTELDLMARLAGMDLEERWSDWRRSPFTRHSEHHVSVYRKLS